MNYVEFSFHCMFKLVQYPARCCMLLQQILIYYYKTPLAPPLAARAAVYHVLPPPVGGRTFILFPNRCQTDAGFHKKDFFARMSESDGGISLLMMAEKNASEEIAKARAGRLLVSHNSNLW